MAEQMKDFELNDDALSDVSGGVGNNSSNDTIKAQCPTCNKITSCKIYSGGRLKCQKCGSTFEE